MPAGRRNDKLVMVLDYQFKGSRFKTNYTMVDSAFHPSKVDQMSIRNSWEFGS